MLVYNLNVIENSLLIHKICLFVNRLADVKKVQVSGALEKLEEILIPISVCPCIPLPLTVRILKQIVNIYIIRFNLTFSSISMNVNIHKYSSGV